MSIPTTSRALVLRHGGYSQAAPSGPYLADGEATRYLDLATQTPATPGPGQLLIRVILANINPSDIHFIKGEYGLPRSQGGGAGFEGVGEVVASGDTTPGAAALVGTRVAFIGATGGTGAWAEHCLVETHSVAPVPDAMRDEDAAALFVNPLTAVGMIDMAKRHAAETGRAGEQGAVVLTAANSQLGQYALAYAQLQDIDIKAICLCRRAQAAEQMRAQGASVALSTDQADYSAAMRAAIAEHKPRMMLDAVGDDSSAAVFWAMPRAARWVIYGLLSTQTPTMSQMGQLIFLNKRIEGFWLTQWFANLAPADQARLVAACCARFVDGTWRTQVDEILGLDEVLDKLPAATRRANQGKVMVRPW